MGCFEREQGERCHLLALFTTTSSGFNIRKVLQVLLRMKSLWNIKSVWLFTDVGGNKLPFDQMNDIFLDNMENLKSMDTLVASGLSDYNI